MSEIKSFEIDIPQADLDDLRGRLARTRFTDAAPGAEFGAALDDVRRLAEYWLDGYVWRVWEARINASPQFTTDIDGQNVHFLHVRSTEPDAFPLILTHGWPGSVVEYLDVVDRGLVERPVRLAHDHGGRAGGVLQGPDVSARIEPEPSRRYVAIWLRAWACPARDAHRQGHSASSVTAHRRDRRTGGGAREPMCRMELACRRPPASSSHPPHRTP